MRTFAALAAVWFLAMTAAARAECGLDQCPIMPCPSALHAAAVMNRTAFDLGGAEGSYTVIGARFEQALGSRCALLRASVSAVRVETDDATETGLANPVVLFQFSPLSRWEGVLSLGTQWEIPLGDDDVNASHHELLSYATVDWWRGRWGFKVVGGYRYSVSDEDGAVAAPAAAPVVGGGPAGISFHDGPTTARLARFVNPHEDHELLWRLGATTPWGPRVRVGAQHVVDGDGGPFVTAEVSLPVSLGVGMQLRPSIGGPLSPERRYDWRFGLEMAIR
jgi:hypothetical protein